MRRVVGIVGEPDQDPGPVARRAPGAGSRELGVVAQDRVASLDRRGQFGLGAADFGGSERVDVEIEPAQAEDVGVTGRVPCSTQPVIRSGQQVGPYRINGDVARDTAQPMGLFDQPLVVVEPAGECCCRRSRRRSPRRDRPGPDDRTRPAAPAARCSRPEAYSRLPETGEPRRVERG